VLICKSVLIIVTGRYRMAREGQPRQTGARSDLRDVAHTGVQARLCVSQTKV
jgi:hypothetical protein